MQKIVRPPSAKPARPTPKRPVKPLVKTVPAKSGRKK